MALWTEGGEIIIFVRTSLRARLNVMDFRRVSPLFTPFALLPCPLKIDIFGSGESLDGVGFDR